MIVHLSNPQRTCARTPPANPTALPGPTPTSILTGQPTDTPYRYAANAVSTRPHSHRDQSDCNLYRDPSSPPGDLSQRTHHPNAPLAHRPRNGTTPAPDHFYQSDSVNTATRMPSLIRPRTIGFAPTPAYSRPARDDEAYVMRAWARHAARCDTCHDPVAAYATKQPLCPRGLRRARDVAQYVYSLGTDKGAAAYSLLDREGGSRARVRVEIPASCEAPVRSLLRAMQQGLVERAPVSVPASYDRTYYVPPRPIIRNVEAPRRQTVRPEAPEHFYRSSPRSSGDSLASSASDASVRDDRLRSYRGKGSLYAHELREQELHRRQRQPVYYRIQGGEAVQFAPA